MKLSIIITAYDQHELTVVHVKESMASTLMPDEVIVINDGGTPDLKDKLKVLDTVRTKLIYVRINEDIPWNYTGARNLGVWLSTGNFIVSEDNDNIPSRKLYEDMFQFLQKHLDHDLILGGVRPKIPLKDVLTKPMEEWKPQGRSPAHDDSFMIRRIAFIKLKGYDERFARKYAWACTDWRRRCERANIKISRVTTHYFNVPDGETKTCLCNKSKEERRKTIHCSDCKLMFKRRSYKNYEYARESDGHTQSPIGILNFTYEFETL